MLNLTSTAAWLAAAGKQYEKISKWPDVDPNKKETLDSFAVGIERVGMRLIEMAEEIRNNGSHPAR